MATSSSPSTAKKITLKAGDDATFEVAEDVAAESRLIKGMMEKSCVHNCIPLPNVTGKILEKVIEYCEKHVEAKAKENSSSDVDDNDDALKEWNANFMHVDQNTLFDIILAADYLIIQGLLDLACKTVAKMMKGKAAEEIREIFNFTNDYSPEEEKEVRKDMQWAFL